MEQTEEKKEFVSFFSLAEVDVSNRLSQQSLSFPCRRETDKNWRIAVYFVSFVCLFLCIAAVCLGDPRNLSLPVDPDGRVCGEGKLSNYPYIYFVTPSKEFMHRAVCVASCPNLTNQPSLSSHLDCAVNRTVKSCYLKLSSARNNREDEVMIYDSFVYQDKVCMPRNAKYFSLILQALSVNKVDQSLADIAAAFPFLLSFTLLAAGLNYLTQISAADSRRLTKLMGVYFFLSSLGFLTVSFLCIARAMQMISEATLQSQEVIAVDADLTGTMQSINSSYIALFLVGIIALLICGIIVKAFRRFQSQQSSEDSSSIIVIRDELLLFSFKLFSLTRMSLVSVISIALSIALLALLMLVESFIFAIGSQVDGPKTLPFDHFKTNFLVDIANAFILSAFFWILLMIIQGVEFIVYATSVYSLDILDSNIMYTNTQDSQTSTLIDQLLTAMSLRLGTIAESALMTFPTFYLRSFCESVDTAVQRRRRRKAGREVESNVIVDCCSSLCTFIQESIVRFYIWSGLKNVQPYGFIYTILNQTDFLESGERMQRKIDSAVSDWYEDILDGGELFEILAKFTITFVVTAIFFITYLAYCNNLAITIAPTLLIMALTCVISNIHINTYGSVYSAVIIYYLLKHEDQKRESNKEEHLKRFHQFIQTLLTRAGRREEDKQQGTGRSTATGQPA